MGTKWKSSIAILLTCSILFTFGVIGLFLLGDYGYYFAHKNYFHTSDFQYEEVDQFTSYFIMFEANDKTLKEAMEGITVTKEEIEEHRYRYGELPEQLESINQRYEELIQNALDEDNQEVADAYIKERDAKINDITKNFESDEYVEGKIIKEKEEILKEYYKEREQYRSHYNQLKDSFQYYFTETTTGKVYTNLVKNEKEASVSDINESSMLFYSNQLFGPWDIYYDFSDEAQSMLNLEQIELEGRIGIPNNLSSSNQFMDRYEEYKIQQIVFWSITAPTLLALFLSLFIFKKAKKTRAEVMRWKKYYDKLPIDMRVLLFGISMIITAIIVVVLVQEMHYITHSYIPDIIFGVIIFPIGLVLTLIQAIYLLKTLKDWKTLSGQWKQSLLYKGFFILRKYLVKLTDKLKEAFLNQTTGTQIILIFGLVFILGFAAVFNVGHPIHNVLYIIFLGGVGIPLALLIINKIGEFNRIVENTNELAAGNLSHNLEVKGNTVLAALADNINVLKQGVKQSQTEQAKSERLKTELITNVSHDLRTPLTSIITYTELLKEQKDIGEESAAYLEIIDRKSKRLKILIDDLFEVSKMASGNIELRKEKVDLVQLLQQALGEYDDMINESTLQFRVSHDDPPLIAVVDGQKLWRVFDNLIGNILKYSLEHSRVYINLSAKKGKAMITFKNVSKYELKESTDELFERFKRGDTSRHTDGSGLGLAIAQSIVELHDGELEIDTDGDLFKVTITIHVQD
ncbi:HAMP domain-containing sensor histidine kinase [Paucisalibacillus sp. EB02]|uniref:HAMP domain-containing sensor histidine kinase n=1 Tax=Paucisalibacillus sp. EB02 TaxID=1347087 RepID=UPI0004B8A9CF|nr:HAMP domain-containing sensor histidine kinase [Paucisalibacillus sp. EB02]